MHANLRDGGRGRGGGGFRGTSRILVVAAVVVVVVDVVQVIYMHAEVAFTDRKSVV